VTLSPGTPAATFYPGSQASIALTMSNPKACLCTSAPSLETGQEAGRFAVDAATSGAPCRP
jgi:hypothetical protein